MTTGPRTPRLLLAPEVIHEDESFVVWHTGVVHGPDGAVTTAVELMSLGPDSFIGHPGWDMSTRDEFPVDAELSIDGEDPIGGSIGSGVRKSGASHPVRFARVGDRIEPGTILYITVPPLGVRVLRELNPVPG